MAKRPTMGVEEEFLLVDGAGRPAPEGPEVLAAIDLRDADLKPELMRCQVESASAVCDTVDELRADLTRLRTLLSDAAHERGLRLIASGTAPGWSTGEPVLGPDPRYHRIASHFESLVHNGMSCGCHVHVAVADRETALQVINHLRPWLPVLLALSANSPFHLGRDTGYASWRYPLWSRWPTAGPPPYLDSIEEYESVVRGMLVSSAALDRKMIYWDARPSEHQPTVEIRVADVAGTVDEAALLGVLVRTLVAEFLDRIEHGEPAPRLRHEALRGSLWRAARDGLEGHCADPLTGELRPALRILDDLTSHVTDPDECAFVKHTLATLAEHGSGAHRQRLAYARHGSLSDVTDALATQTVDYATR